MIKAIYGDESRLEKLKEVTNSKIFNYDELEKFLDECFSTSIFGTNPILILKNAHNLKDFSFLDKIPKNREIIIEGYDEKGEFAQRINVEKQECREQTKDKISILQEKFKISYREAYTLAELMTNFTMDLEKLENLFYDKAFSFSDAEQIFFTHNEIEIFKSVDNLLSGNKRDAIQYAKTEDCLPFIGVLNTIFKTILKIKLLNIEENNYEKFKNEIYPKYKKMLGHPYFVFKNIKLAKKYNKKTLSKAVKAISNAQEEVRLNFPHDVILLKLIEEL